MSLTVNTNIGAMIAGNELTRINNSYEKLQEQATTGKRINSASDDAAGLAIVMGMQKEYRGNEAALKNINQGKDLLSTKESALNTISDMFLRLEELAVGASNGTMSDTDRTTSNQEAQYILSEITRISESTTYNGIKILDGTNANIGLQIGNTTGTESKMTVALSDFTVDNLSIDSGDLTSAANAQTFMDNLKTDMETMKTALGTIGAYTNRLDYASNNLVSANESLKSSMSTIQDADMAKVSQELAKNEVLRQMGFAMLSKSNQAPFSYLNLIA